MTTGVATALAVPARTAAAAPRRLVAALPWLLAAAGVAAGLAATGTPTADIARWAAYWALAVVLPGTLTYRALRGSRGNLPEDVGYGATVGLVLELLAWTLAAATGAQALLRWWALPVVLTFAAVPRLRRCWRIADPRPLPRRAAWLLAAVLLLATGVAVLRWAQVPLPPVTADYYQDLLYHLALVHELTRAMPFEVPQVAGEALRYHYLSDAHVAVGSMITDVAPATALLRLWLLPVVAVAVLVTAGLTRDLTGRWWAGPLAAAGAYLGVPLALGAPAAVPGGSAVSYVSPSLTYALPFVLLLAGLCVEVVRGGRLGAAWVLVPVLGLVCAGAKASALPPVVAGLGLAAAVLLLRTRRLPWPTGAAAGALVAAMLVGAWLFAGGGAGTLRLHAFSVLRWTAPYQETLGARDGMAAGGLLPAGLARAGTAGWLFALAVVLWWVLMQATRLLGLAGGAVARLRADPAWWLLGGAVVAGNAAAWLLFHPSASQVYFFTGTVPLGVVLTVWLLCALPARTAVVGGAFAVGAAITWLAPRVGRPPAEQSAWLWALARPTLRALAVGAAAAAIAVTVAWTVRRLRAATGPRFTAPAWLPPARLAAGRGAVLAAGPGAVLAAVLGASVTAGVQPVSTLVTAGVPGAPPVAEPLAVTADEMRAALWLDAHAADDDVVATNVHCQPVATTPRCDARAFWVTGLGGHRALVESWGYSDAAVAAHGRDGLPYPRQAPPAVFDLNERVFTTPTAADLARLRDGFGVRWLLADTRAGFVSPDLAGLAQPRLVAGPVTVYALR